jgi:hypothetical protein
MANRARRFLKKVFMIVGMFFFLSWMFSDSKEPTSVQQAREREQMEAARQQAFYDASSRGYIPPTEQKPVMNQFRRSQFSEKQSKVDKNGVEYVFVHDSLTNKYMEMTRAQFENLKKYG